MICLHICHCLSISSGGYTPGEIKKAPDSWLDVFNVIPVICFGYQVSTIQSLVKIYLKFVLSPSIKVNLFFGKGDYARAGKGDYIRAGKGDYA